MPQEVKIETFDVCLVNAYDVVPKKAGTTGHNVSRDDCEYVGVCKNDGLSVVLLTGAADLRIWIVEYCRRPSNTSCMAFCCSGLCVSFRFGSSITFGFEPCLVCALLSAQLQQSTARQRPLTQ